MNRRGKVCKQAAGWGTDHPGWGACKLHGGSTPNGRKAALRQASKAMMRADVVEIDIDPVEGQLYPIRRCAALAAFYRMRMAQVEAGGQSWLMWAAHERKALEDMARWSKLPTRLPGGFVLSGA